jgi:NAD(P)-dependent dehydrogenase (short-subunit alcohol dehydrogenase family)
VHIHAYKLKLEPMLWSPAALTPESLASRLAGDAVVQRFAAHPSGAHVVSVGLRRDRESHKEALNELLLAVQELGYTFVEAEITRIADRAIEMAVGLGVGGLGAGSATDNAELALLGAGVGWVVGLLVGANMEKVEVLYRVQWTSAGWHLTPTSPQPAVRPALRTA